VHTAWRVPLSPRGILFMKCVYMTVPVVSGLYVMSLAIGRSEDKWRSKDFERRMVERSELERGGGLVGGRRVDGERVGAGGVGGGVHLIESSGDEQEGMRRRLGVMLGRARVDKRQGADEGKS
ncbi:hypothetical protein TeGR_g12824, partial [Tetraparma gracilis]